MADKRERDQEMKTGEPEGRGSDVNIIQTYGVHTIPHDGRNRSTVQICINTDILNIFAFFGSQEIYTMGTGCRACDLSFCSTPGLCLLLLWHWPHALRMTVLTVRGALQQEQRDLAELSFR